MITLDSLKENEEAQIIRINAGRNLVLRLSDMGLVPNTKFKVILNPSLGPILLEVRGTKLAIGRGMARKIVVMRENSSK